MNRMTRGLRDHASSGLRVVKKKVSIGGFSASEPAQTLPHETTHDNRFISQLLDHYPENTPKVSNWSRNCLLERVMTNTFGVFISVIQ